MLTMRKACVAAAAAQGGGEAVFSSCEIDRLRSMVFALTGCNADIRVDVEEGEGLSVLGDARQVRIVAESKPALARGFFRLAQELAGGQTVLSVRERKRFDSCGCFLDVSRNAVMTVEACKRYMNVLAALGMNLLVLYTEDTFTVPEYRYLGYLRGRYTPEELRALDAHAASLGIELVPCIQTLGHLGQFLQWNENIHLRDQPAVILADEPETYRFIEAEIRAMRACVRGARLHIGMDEAHGVGLGNYYAKHGPTDRFALLSRHLDKVVALCRQYGFRPMMWSDMFFRLGSRDNEYYDRAARIPQSVIDGLPEVDLVYWDYYHTDADWYEHMLAEHERMNAHTIFAGGIWTWSGFLPHVRLSYATMEPALAVCARRGVKTVMATLWGDDGAETNHFLAVSQLPLFSEFCWRGNGCTREAVEAAGECISGLPRDAFRAFGMFYPDERDRRTGKALVYCDLLYPLGPQGEELRESVARSEEALSLLAPYPHLPECRYASALFEVCRQKALLLTELRPRYLAGDRAWLDDMARRRIPELLDAYKTLRAQHRALWERDNKRNGWEVMALRYGSVIGRLEDVQDAVLRYCAGTLSALCELEEEPLDSSRKFGMQFYSTYVSPVWNV